ncbi:nuclear transport factor 2 family protein [Phaeobacter inhibens]|uniref:nuclear transport factor 2 family protein n=1 Tax=Phaeobacter inhibens TaxID=221822 RepID=UPI0021A60B1D|nr:nuclear transport factor 2 family protein [Phaeobacter inhibens]UWR46810.1 nuclear transport factor 2 family protein [Phaeobacter inhibens]
MTATLKDVIAEKSRQFEADFAAGDVAALVEGYYTPDPVVIGQGIGTFTGPDGASAYFLGAVQDMKTAQLSTTSVQHEGRSAIETGRVVLTPRAEGTGDINLAYVVVWQNGEDGWKVHMDYFMPAAA